MIGGIFLAGNARAELTAEQTNKAEALIKQFSAREFAVRQEAVARLVKMGPDVILLIKRTLAETTDAEVKLRCRMVLKGLTAARRLVERRVKDLGPPQPPGSRYGPRRSANGESVAYTIRRGGQMLVVHNGKEGPEYDLAGAGGHIAFSPDGRRLAYIAKRADKGFIVCDGVEGPHYDGVYNPWFSPDGKRLAYFARRAKTTFVVCDGKERQGLTWPDQRPEFSPDSRHFYRAGRRGKKLFVVIDGKEGLLHDDISLRGVVRNKLHYVAFDDDRLSLMEAEWPTAGQRNITEVIRKRLPASVALGRMASLISSYAPRRGEAHLATTVGPVSWGRGRKKRTEAGSVQFSPYGQHEAYAIVAKRGKKTAVVFRDRELGTYDRIHLRVLFSPDGNHVAYSATRDGKGFVAWDGNEGPPCSSIQMVTFSPDGRHLVYVARRAGKWVLLRDGRELPQFSPITRFTFSPDSRHLAYIAKRGLERFVVCDGREGPPYREIHGITFSPDSRHLCYVANGDMMVCDGIEGPAHEKIVSSGHPRIYAGKALRYIALDGNRERLVEVDWPKDLDWTNGLKSANP